MFWQSLIAKVAGCKAIRSFISGPEGTSGAALVEFTVLVPLMLPIAIYAMDYGLLIFNKMEVQHAAQAGAQYAIQQVSYDATGIASAVTNATNFTAVTATSSQFCGCAASTGVTKCSDSCDTCKVSTCVQGHYVTVTASPVTPYKSLITFGSVSANYDLTAQSTVRIR